jgi:hypothetical protein
MGFGMGMGCPACGCAGTCIVTDNFNRADNTDIDAGSTAGWTESSGDWSIASNKLLFAGGLSEGVVLCDTLKALIDPFPIVQVRFRILPENDFNGPEVSLLLGYVDSSNYYKVTYSAVGEHLASISFRRVVGGVEQFPRVISGSFFASSDGGSSVDYTGGTTVGVEHVLTACLGPCGEILSATLDGELIATAIFPVGDPPGDVSGIAAIAEDGVEFDDFVLTKSTTGCATCNRTSFCGLCSGGLDAVYAFLVEIAGATDGVTQNGTFFVPLFFASTHCEFWDKDYDGGPAIQRPAIDIHNNPSDGDSIRVEPKTETIGIWFEAADLVAGMCADPTTPVVIPPNSAMALANPDATCTITALVVGDCVTPPTTTTTEGEPYWCVDNAEDFSCEDTSCVQSETEPEFICGGPYETPEACAEVCSPTTTTTQPPTTTTTPAPQLFCCLTASDTAECIELAHDETCDVISGPYQDGAECLADCAIPTTTTTQCDCLPPPNGPPCLLQVIMGVWASAGGIYDCGTNSGTPCTCWVCDDGDWKSAGDATSQTGVIVGGVCDCQTPTSPCA